MKRLHRLSSVCILAVAMGLSGIVVAAQEEADDIFLPEQPEVAIPAQDEAPLVEAPAAAAALPQEESDGIPLLDRRNFRFNMALYADALRFVQETYSHQEVRLSHLQKNRHAFSGPFSGADWLGEDTNIRLRYETPWFGGHWSFDSSNIQDLGRVRAWVRFCGPDTYLRIIAGNDNDFTFADSQGADPGLRVYMGGTGVAWRNYINPDNITRGDGIALNMVLRDLNLDLAASRFNVTPLQHERPPIGSNDFEINHHRDIQFGGRIGYRIGDFGRVNFSYIMNYVQDAHLFTWAGGNVLTPSRPDAQIYTHSFGLFASLTPMENLGVTVGYASVVTQFLDSYHSPLGVMLETTFPRIWRHGINLNWRYSGLMDGRLRIRNDNNFTIFSDRNYSAFEPVSPWGTNHNATSGGAHLSDVRNLFLWNGLGVEYDLMQFDAERRLVLGFYGRNLFRQVLARNVGGEREYRFVRNETMVEVLVRYFFNDRVQVFGGARYQNLLTSRSADLTGQMANFFVPGLVMPGDAVAVRDSVLTLSVPIGILISW